MWAKTPSEWGTRPEKPSGPHVSDGNKGLPKLGFNRTLFVEEFKNELLNKSTIKLIADSAGANFEVLHGTTNYLTILLELFTNINQASNIYIYIYKGKMTKHRRGYYD